VLQKNSCATPWRGGLVCFHGKSDTKIAEIAGIAEAGVRRHGGRSGRPYRAGRSMAEPMERD
jgi:hypothetical protein